MLFSSPIFLLFFSLYFLPHLFVPARWRVGLIIFGSTLFYAHWNVAYAWIPMALTLIAYYGTTWMDKATLSSKRTKRVCLVVTTLLLPLLFFKYTNFFLGHKVLTLALPLGISFVSFTLIAYVVDVYRYKFPRQTQPWNLLGAVFFFPHLIAGPIVRPSQLIPQLARPLALSGIPFHFGLSLFTLGLIKKLVIADPIAQQVDLIYGSSQIPTPAQYWFAFYGFAIQIYCDFSGYTDMALGLARLLGIRLPQNFSMPYTATSLIDFWHRWHITLSTWLRDYLYIPLGGNKNGVAHRYKNLFITMVLGGLWHGANMTFVIWGTLHGLALGVSHALRSYVKLPRLIGIFLTFNFVSLAWVFFRASDVSSAVRFLGGMIHNPLSGGSELLSQNLFCLVLFGIFFLTHSFDSHARLRLAVRKIPKGLLWPALIFSWLLAITISHGNTAQFIYFEF
jgi:alginate O-acetyltransferase complex protein AlgI